MKIREVPFLADKDLYGLLQEIRQHVITNTPNAQPPKPVTNLRITAQPLGALVEWTRSDADGYLLYLSDSPVIDMAKGRAIDAGKSTMYSDYIGAAGVTRYYWVRAYRSNAIGPPVGPVQATTLAAGAVISVPAPLPSSQTIRQDPTLGHQNVGVDIGQQDPSAE